MKLLIQRVARASVSIDGVVYGEIGGGCMVLAGCRSGDTFRDASYLAARLVALRIFKDELGKMNLSVTQTGGALLVVSQFTLYADTRKGNRPGFTVGGDPGKAREIYDFFVNEVSRFIGSDRVRTGVFGADMQVELVNDGPVTVELCSDNQPWHKTDVSG